MLLRLFLLLGSFVPVKTTLIHTPLGLIKSREFHSKDGSLVHAFKKIPYAQPPVGRLRFALPERVRKWDGVWDATEYGPACMSNSTSSKSNPKVVGEDCLFNAIFVSERCLKTRNCPVVVYIHGGMFNFDSSVTFPDDSLINNFDVVLVTVEYRLGFFASLTFANDNVVPGNLAAYDMIESLRWVQQYIDSFGGNRDQVTLMGHSGGGSAVNAISLSKSIDPKRKLFHRAISLSPQQITKAQDEAHRRVKTWEFASKAGCLPYEIGQNPSDNFVQEVVDCLREKDSFELLGIQRQMEEEGFTIFGWMIKAPLFPSSNLYDFVENPPKISMMIGTLINDMQHQLDDNSVTVADFLGLRHPNAVAKRVNADIAAGKFNYYTDTDDSRLARPLRETSASQSLFTGVYRIAQQLTKAGSDVYVYSYRYPKHAMHTDDMSYLLGIHPFEADENEKILGHLYRKYVITYIKTGVPDPDWQRYRLEDNNYFAINYDTKTGLGPKTALGYEQKVIDYWFKNMTLYDEYLSRSRFDRESRGLIFSERAAIALTNWLYLFGILGLILTGCYIAVRKARWSSGLRSSDQKIPLLQ